jgi:hypothetical protein
LVFSQYRLTIPARCSVDLTAYRCCFPRRTSCDARGSARTGPPFDTGITAIQSLFTGTLPKVASLVAIVIGGYAFAHGRYFQRLDDVHFCCQSDWCSYLSLCLVEPANKRPPTGQWGEDCALPAADMPPRIALRLQRTSAASMRMRASSGTCLPFMYPVFCLVTASGFLRRPAALGLLLRVARPSGVTVPPTTSLRTAAKKAAQTSFGPLPESRPSALGSGTHSPGFALCDPSNNGKFNKRRHDYVPISYVELGRFCQRDLLCVPWPPVPAAADVTMSWLPTSGPEVLLDRQITPWRRTK